jgi:alpha-beta hydrolase superfamily lysophospholipase
VTRVGSKNVEPAASQPGVSFGSFADGTTRLERRWAVDEPRAALLVVHGIGEHSGRYGNVGAALADVDIDVMAFDNRGFGQSGGRRAFVTSFDQYVDDVVEMLEERQSHGAPTILLGHSLGGLIAARSLVSGRATPDLSILSAPALMAEVPRWQRLLAPVLGRLAPKVFIPAKIDGDLLSRDLDVQREYLQDPLVIAGATAGLGNEIFRAMKETSSAISRIGVPTYVIHGEIDRLVPTAASDGVAGLPNAERRLWSGLRHECFHEPEQDDVIAEMIAWIESKLGDDSAG